MTVLLFIVDLLVNAKNRSALQLSLAQGGKRIGLMFWALPAAPWPGSRGIKFPPARKIFRSER